MKNQVEWKRTIRDFSVLVLLMLYSVASLRIDSLHQFFHAENIVELHSAEQESDPCHKSIYHQQSDDGCAHQSHITQNNKCPLCEYRGYSDVLFIPFDEAQAIDIPTQADFFYTGPFEVSLLLTQSERGPPSLV